MIENEIKRLRKKGINLSKSDLHFITSNDQSIASLRSKLKLKNNAIDEPKINIAGYMVNLSNEEVSTLQKKLRKSFKQVVKTDTLSKGGEYTKNSRPNEFGKYNHGLFFNKDIPLQVSELKSYNKDKN